MHYYQFNIGDYASHTRHLSPIEDIAYRRLLDNYYLSERPFNSNVTTVARQIGLKEYEQEVEQVLNEFFELIGDGWIHYRAEKEISNYKSKIDNASKAGKASAEKRLNARSTDVQLTNNHKPLTNNQEPIINTVPTVLVKSSSDFDLTSPRINCPVNEIVDIYHEECKSLARVMMMNTTRKKHLVSRWREVDAEDNLQSKDEGLEIFRNFFRQVNKSDFLSGRTNNKNGRVWKASFDWLMLPTNFLKVCEGQYDNGRK